MKSLNSKKGQVSLSDAPQIVFIVGFIFLLMATVAYVSSEYRTGMGRDVDLTVNNESVTKAEYTAGAVLDGAAQCNSGDFSIVSIINNTDGVKLLSGNYSLDSTTGALSNITAEYSESEWDVTYTYSHGGISCNVTEGLETELDDNTSIAGVVLTISLIGIVLSILIGIFMGFRGRRL